MTQINEQFVIDYLAYKAGRPLKLKELARELKVAERDYVHFRGMVKKLLDEGRLVKLKRNRLGVPSELNLAVGQITISRGGFGTVLTETEKPINIAPSDTLTALDGDKVMVRVSGGVEGELHGKVIKVMERAERNIVGIFHTGPHFDFIVP